MGSRLEISLEGGNSYRPSEPKLVTVRVLDTHNVYGFQMTARFATDPLAQAGSFRPVDNTSSVRCANADLSREDPRTGDTCGPAVPLEYIGHDRPNNVNTFVFRWIPPPSGAGEIILYAAANAANGDVTRNGDRIHAAQLRLAPVARPTINTNGIITANEFGAARTITPQTWIEIYGRDLAPSPADWSATIGSGTAPTEINGVSVMIGGRPAFLSYVSPTQINAQVPDGIGPGTTTLTIRTPGGTSDPYNLPVADASPGLYAPSWFKVPGGRQFVAAVHPSDNVFVGQPNFLGPTIRTRSARPGDRILIYAIGLGATNPRQTAGNVVRDQNAIGAFVMRFGTATIATEYAGLVPGFVGLYQLNAVVPDIGTGEWEVTGSVASGISIPSGLFINLR